MYGLLAVVSFTSIEEFERELELNKGEIQDDILRVTIRKDTQPPFARVSVIAGYLWGECRVELKALIGNVGLDSANDRGVYNSADATVARLMERAASLGLQVRAGSFN